MRMFLYYALHSTINQIKKIFKTWVMIFIGICFLIGVGLGLIFATLDDISEKHKEETGIEEMVETEQEDTQDPQNDEPNYIEQTIGYTNLLELIIGGVVLLSFGFSIMNADKNAGKIFLPADVTLLFPAPLKPQSVMLFRIATQFGQMIFINIYLLFQLPNLVLNMGLSLWAALTILLGFCLMTFSGTLLQLLFYLLGSISATFKKQMRPIFYGILSMTAGGYILYQKSMDMDYLTAAAGFFNNEISRLIPFWGWLKAMCIYAVEGDMIKALLFFGLILVGIVVLIRIIWGLKVDYYEDAMAKAEETAELLERAKSDNTAISVRRKKDRSDRLKRDGMKHGAGANVFFFKEMYNRFRFAHFGFLTKTMEFYLTVAVIVGVLCRFSFETKSPFVLLGALGAFVFFRSLGNPLDKDTKMQYFILIPESTWAKLFYSLMAGTVNTAMDLILPLLVGSLIMGANPLVVLLGLIPLLSIDLYSTVVGVFIGLSVPTSAGQMIKQMVQILFVYFGLLPDIIILAVFFMLDMPIVGIIGAFVMNLLLAGLFFGLSPLFLDPVGKKTAKVGEEIFLN